MQYTVEQIAKMRGFHALTQGEERVEIKLLSNINELKGKKVIGFNKTRREVLSEEFDLDSLTSFVGLSMEMCVAGLVEKADAVTTGVCKSLLEKIFRDFVALDMVVLFVQAIVNRFEILGDEDSVVKSFEKYLTSGKVVPVAQSYMEMDEEIRKGAIIYDVPNTI